MRENNKMNAVPKPPSKLVLTAILSSSLTSVLAVVYLILSIIALIYRFDCEAFRQDTVSGSSFLIATVYRAYIQDNGCNNTYILPNQITTDYSVFVLTCITLTASFVCLVSAITLIAAVTSETGSQYLSIVVYGYVGVWVASFIVDLTFAVHFGMDYSHLNSLINNFSAGLSMNYQLDVLRIGAFGLMTLALKGYLSHVINLALLVLLIIYVIEYTKSVDEYEHSIHKLGVIKAYDRKRHSESIQQPNPGLVNNGGPNMNFGYMHDEPPPRSLTRENSRRERDDYSTSSFDRAYPSWQQSSSSVPRPFSYLEEPRRGLERGASVPAEWRRSQWPAPPPVPAPDYSPHAPRRLKSALKPAYM